MVYLDVFLYVWYVYVISQPTSFFRKEQLDMSVAQCWSVLLTQTRQESRDHSSLSELCSNTLTQRLSHCIDDTQRLAKRVKIFILLSVMSSDFHPLSLPLLFTDITYSHTQQHHLPHFTMSLYSLCFRARRWGYKCRTSSWKSPQSCRRWVWD